MKKIRYSIIIPEYKPNKIILDKIKGYLQKNINNEFEILEIEGSNGLAATYNQGIKKSKGEILITLHQDCIPLEEDSLKKIVEPFKNKKIVMTYSKIVDYDSKKTYIPFIPDGKFNAFRKSALEKVKMFDERTFFTGGEDIDIYFKLKKIGKIILVNTKIFHDHPNYKGNKTLEKKKQNGSINGVLVRKYGIEFPLWWKSIIYAMINPLSYGKEFLKAFISGKQKYRRKE